MRIPISVIGAALCAAGAAHAASATVTVNQISDAGIGAQIGTLELRDSPRGLEITPALAGLPPGKHGFHVHLNADCGVAESNGKMAAGFAAGPHLDPAKTGKHLGPLSTEGHKGDLPVLAVDSDGKASTPMLAPNLKLDDVRGHAIMIHEGGDNYADKPVPLGGGGRRIACAVVR